MEDDDLSRSLDDVGLALNRPARHPLQPAPCLRIELVGFRIHVVVVNVLGFRGGPRLIRNLSVGRVHNSASAWNLGKEVAATQPLQAQVFKTVGSERNATPEASDIRLAIRSTRWHVSRLRRSAVW